jgi:hypothetical protein
MGGEAYRWEATEGRRRRHGQQDSADCMGFAHAQ